MLLPAVFPELSVAITPMECVPLETVGFQEMEYGAVVNNMPRFPLSRVNCTLAIPTLPEAVAETVTIPETIAPLAGEVIVTMGALFETMTVTVAVDVFPAVFLATALRV